MKVRLFRWWTKLRTNYWFIPAVLSVAALIAASFCVHIDREYGSWFTAIYSSIFRAGPDGARAVLSVIAGSVITIASLVFSINVLILSLASSQFGPRLLRNFMQDQTNQVVLGIFVATFLFTLEVLRNVNSYNERSFVPQFSLAIASVLTILIPAALIFYLHHIAVSISAERVISNVYKELEWSIDRLFRRRDDHDSPAPLAHAEERLPAEFDSEAIPIAASRSGFVQAINFERLLAEASERGVVIRLAHRAGQYVVAKSTVALAWPADRVSDEFKHAVDQSMYLGPERTEEQDVEYAISQLVEVALRALSPGVNDPHTAVVCIYRLGSAICRILDRDPPVFSLYDKSNRLRVILPTVTRKACLEACFNEIRDYSRSSLSVAVALLEMFATIATQADASMKEEVRIQAEAVKHALDEGRFHRYDLERVEILFKQIVDVLEA